MDRRQKEKLYHGMVNLYLALCVERLLYILDLKRRHADYYKDQYRL